MNEVVGGGSAIAVQQMNSYGPVGNAPAAMGVKKRLDSSSRIAPDAINNNHLLSGSNYAKTNVSPGHAHQRMSTNTTLPNQVQMNVNKCNANALSTQNSQNNGMSGMAYLSG